MTPGTGADPSGAAGCLALGIDVCGGGVAIAASDGRLPPLATLVEPEPRHPNGNGAPHEPPDWSTRLRAAIERVRRRGTTASRSRCVLAVPPHTPEAERRAALAALEACVDQGLVCSQPFAIVYGIDRAEGPAVLVDVGEQAVHLYRLDGERPQVASHVTLAGGAQQLDLDLVRRLGEAHPGMQPPLEAVRALRERQAALTDPGRAIVAALPDRGRVHCLDVTEIVLAACQELARPVLAALGELLRDAPADLRAALRRNVLLVGSGAQLRGLDTALEDSLAPLGGGRVRSLAQPRYAGCRGALKIAADLPEAAWERMAAAAM